MKNTTSPDKYVMCKEDSIYFLTDDDDESIEGSTWITFTKMKERYLIRNYPTFVMIFTLIFDTFVLFYNLKTKSFLNLITTIIFILFASLKTFNFIYKAIMLKFGGSSWRLAARLHGAMHIVLNTYVEKGSLPTFEETKDYHYVYSECNTFFALKRILVITFLFVMTFFTSNVWIIVISSTILYAILYILDCVGILTYFQMLAVSDPTDFEVKYILKKLQALNSFEDSCYEYVDSSNNDLE